MNNRQIRASFWDFSPRLFREGMRQLKTLGILFTVILSLAAVLLPVGTAVSAYSDVRNGGGITRELVTLIEVHPLVILPMFTLTPIAALVLFGFLNKRKASDFYHAIPVSRAAIFISLYAAIAVWTFIAITVSTALSLVSCLCFPQLFLFDLSSILPLLTGVFCGSLLIASCVTLAMCITGTFFNNVLVAALVFGVPRLLLASVSGILYGTVAVLPSNYNHPFLNIDYHIPLRILAAFFDGDNPFGFSWSHILYTGIIAFLYFLAANFLFRVRKSEAAGYAAATPLLQTIYRLTITFLVTMIPVWLLYECLFGSVSLDAEECFYIIVLYLAAALVFCIYELLTTRKPQRLLKAAPTFGIVLAADVVLFVVIIACRYTALSFRPTPEEITGVSFQNEQYRNQEDYFAARTNQVTIKDPAVLKLVAERLQLSASRNDLYAGLSPEENRASERFIVAVKTKGVARQRLLYFSEEQTKTIMDCFAKDATYQEVYTLPDPSSHVSVSIAELTQEQADGVYALMCREMARLPFEKRYRLLAGNEQYSTGFTQNVWIRTSLHSKTYSLPALLSAENFPESYDRYLSYRYSDKAARSTVYQALQNPEPSPGMGLDLTISLYPKDGDESMVYLSTSDDKKVLADAVLAALADAVPTHNDSLCYIFVEEWNENKWKTTEHLFAVKPEAVQTLKDAIEAAGGTVYESKYEYAMPTMN